MAGVWLPLGTTDWRQERELEKKRIAELQKRPPAAWRPLRKAAGLAHVRFHDGRHTALTRLAEKGVAAWVIEPSSATSRRR